MMYNIEKVADALRKNEAQYVVFPDGGETVFVDKNGAEFSNLLKPGSVRKMDAASPFVHWQTVEFVQSLRPEDAKQNEEIKNAALNGKVINPEFKHKDLTKTNVVIEIALEQKQKRAPESGAGWVFISAKKERVSEEFVFGADGTPSPKNPSDWLNDEETNAILGGGRIRRK